MICQPSFLPVVDLCVLMFESCDYICVQVLLSACVKIYSCICECLHVVYMFECLYVIYVYMFIGMDAKENTCWCLSICV